jgi:hypothetical protein
VQDGAVLPEQEHPLRSNRSTSLTQTEQQCRGQKKQCRECCWQIRNRSHVISPGVRWAPALLVERSTPLVFDCGPSVACAEVFEQAGRFRTTRKPRLLTVLFAAPESAVND